MRRNPTTFDLYHVASHDHVLKIGVQGGPLYFARRIVASSYLSLYACKYAFIHLLYRF